jgi:quercetin dioxygenase-like cupin family protein
MSVDAISGRVIGSEEAAFSIADGPFPLWHKVEGSDTGGAVLAQVGIMNPGILNPPHTHSREDELLYILEGDMTVEIGNVVHAAPRGTTVWLPRGIRHATWNSSERSARYFEVITPAVFEGWFHELGRLLAGGGLSLEKVLGLAPKYGLQFDMPHAGELMERYGLRPPA